MTFEKTCTKKVPSHCVKLRGYCFSYCLPANIIIYVPPPQFSRYSTSNFHEKNRVLKIFDSNNNHTFYVKLNHDFLKKIGGGLFYQAHYDDFISYDKLAGPTSTAAIHGKFKNGLIEKKAKPNVILCYFFVKSISRKKKTN